MGETKTLRLLFVCSGNICRSPMAAALAQAKAGERGMPAVVLSCGTLGLVGHSAAHFGQVAMQELEIDISSHYSQGVQPAMLDVADHVFVMAPRHEVYLTQHAPRVAPKVVRMWEWADEQLSQIDDPVGKDLEAFRVCRDLLERCLERWFESLTAVSQR